MRLGNSQEVEKTVLSGHKGMTNKHTKKKHVILEMSEKFQLIIRR